MNNVWVKIFDKKCVIEYVVNKKFYLLYPRNFNNMSNI